MIDDAVQAKLTSSSTNDLRVSIRLPKREGSEKNYHMEEFQDPLKLLNPQKKKVQKLYTSPNGICFQKLLYFFGLNSLVSAYKDPATLCIIITSILPQTTEVF
tara:strand:- start:11 stop:319 length:309 start_codon:yes stop_codon:yes gene_type:complete